MTFIANRRSFLLGGLATVAVLAVPQVVKPAFIPLTRPTFDPLTLPLPPFILRDEGEWSDGSIIRTFIGSRTQYLLRVAGDWRMLAELASREGDPDLNYSWR